MFMTRITTILHLLLCMVLQKIENVHYCLLCYYTWRSTSWKTCIPILVCSCPKIRILPIIFVFSCLFVLFLLLFFAFVFSCTEPSTWKANITAYIHFIRKSRPGKRTFLPTLLSNARTSRNW